MDEVCTHWKRLRFDDDYVMKDDKLNISILIEWDVIQASDNMILHIKEKLRKFSYPETTYLKPLSQPIKTKSAHKKVKLTSSDNSTTRSTSYFEHVDKLFPDYLTSKSKKNVFSKELPLANQHIHHLYPKSN